MRKNRVNYNIYKVIGLVGHIMVFSAICILGTFICNKESNVKAYGISPYISGCSFVIGDNESVLTKDELLYRSGISAKDLEKNGINKDDIIVDKNELAKLNHGILSKASGEFHINLAIDESSSIFSNSVLYSYNYYVLSRLKHLNNPSIFYEENESQSSVIGSSNFYEENENQSSNIGIANKKLQNINNVANTVVSLTVYLRQNASGAFPKYNKEKTSRKITNGTIGGNDVTITGEEYLTDIKAKSLAKIVALNRYGTKYDSSEIIVNEDQLKVINQTIKSKESKKLPLIFETPKGERIMVKVEVR
ncbi:MAG: hypothetical protein LBM02_04635 [Lachnospiraceae bacterium]|jgi:hypothetical protein|nr:hypothetical protein [Lachnospiraceae bacterium]